MINESRRTFLLAAAALWQVASAQARLETKTDRLNAKIAFLNPAQRDVLLTLVDRFVPADERSAGAVGAKVDEYIDFVLFHADSTLQGAWRKGLDRYGAAIKSKSGSEIDEFLQVQARAEFSPASDDERFFVLLKMAVTEGFYTSEEGITRELGYQGMSFNMDAAGCTHSTHEIPAGYKPLLQSVQKV